MPALYKTRYGEAIERILMRHGIGPSTITALEILIQTAQANQAQESRADLAAKTCRGLHMDKPGRGVVCSKCFDAAFEHGVSSRALTGDQRAGMKGLGSPGPQGPGEPPGAPASQEPVGEVALAAEVASLIGAPPSDGPVVEEEPE